MTGWQRYTHTDLHKRLCGVALSERYRERQGAQALFCPYYVTLEGRLG